MLIMIPDKSYGVIMLASLASFFSYFTFWIIVTVCYFYVLDKNDSRL